MRSMRSVKKAVNCCCEKGRILIKHGRKQQAGSDISVIMIRKRKPDGLVSVFLPEKISGKETGFEIRQKNGRERTGTGGQDEPGKMGGSLPFRGAGV